MNKELSAKQLTEFAEIMFRLGAIIKKVGDKLTPIQWTHVDYLVEQIKFKNARGDLDASYRYTEQILDYLDANNVFAKPITIKDL